MYLPPLCFIRLWMLVQISLRKCHKTILKTHMLFYLCFGIPENKISMGGRKLLYKRLPAPPYGRTGSCPPCKKTGSLRREPFSVCENNAGDKRFFCPGCDVRNSFRAELLQFPVYSADRKSDDIEVISFNACDMSAECPLNSIGSCLVHRLPGSGIGRDFIL